MEAAVPAYGIVVKMDFDTAPREVGRRCRTFFASMQAGMGISLTTPRLPQDTKVTGPVGRRFGSREVVRVEVEIWPTSMVFKNGHRICLDIQPRDDVGSLHGIITPITVPAPTPFNRRDPIS